MVILERGFFLMDANISFIHCDKLSSSIGNVSAGGVGGNNHDKSVLDLMRQLRQCQQYR